MGGWLASTVKKDLRRFRRGFTIIEILTVIIIIGILVSLTSYAFSVAARNSRDQTRKSDLQTIKNALEQFYLDNRNYPVLEDIGLPAKILDATWQLERVTDTDCHHVLADKKFLAPTYIVSVPHDPQHYDQPVGGAGCSYSTNLGHYIYYPWGVANETQQERRGYYLFALMEKSDDANLTGVTMLNLLLQNFKGETTLTDLGIWLLGYGSSSQICLPGDVTGSPPCSVATHNYVLKSSPNDQ